MQNFVSGAQGFRVFFLLASLFSISAMGLWALLLNQFIEIQPYGGWRFWHAHEMLFGYSAAVIAGFLLTAVRAWTGHNTLAGLQLLPLAVIWLAARVLMLFENAETVLIISVDLLFWALLAIVLARPVLVKRQSRNLFAVISPLLLMIASSLSHAGVQSGHIELEYAGLYGGLFIIVVLMSLIGVRVIPLFTRNTTHLESGHTPVWLNHLIAGLLWGLAIAHLIPGFNYQQSLLVGSAMLFTGLLMTLRLGNWQLVGAVKYPMLWSLHLGYAFIPLGLILFGLHYLGLIAQADSGIHAITAGAIGGLTLSMMARVSLGHTGRRIESDPCLLWIFLLIYVAALIRTISAMTAIDSLNGWSWSAVMWLLAFGLFIWRFLPIWLSPRVDGKTG